MIASVSALIASIDSALVPEVEAARMARLHGEADVLADAERRKQVGDLERAADAGARDLLRRMSGDRLAQQRHRALRPADTCRTAG